MHAHQNVFDYTSHSIDLYRAQVVIFPLFTCVPGLQALSLLDIFLRNLVLALRMRVTTARDAKVFEILNARA